MSSPVQQQAKRERGGAGQERAGGASTGCCFGRHVDGAMGLRVYKGRAPWWCYSPILEQRVPGWSSGHWTLQVAATVISDPRFGWGISRLSPRYSVYSEEYRGAKGETTELTPVEL